MFSIRWKLTLSYVLLSVATAVVVGFVSFFLIKNYVDNKTKEQMHRTAESIEQEIRPLFGGGHVEEMKGIADAFGLANNLRIRVLDFQRELLAGFIRIDIVLCHHLFLILRSVRGPVLGDAPGPCMGGS